MDLTEGNEGNEVPSSSALAFVSEGGDFGFSMREEETNHSRRAEDAQDEILRAMSPGRRLQIARELYETAWQIKAAGLRREHPDWPEERVMGKLRRVFVTGYAGA
jgi:Rv0078B-related antitoxin